MILNDSNDSSTRMENHGICHICGFEGQLTFEHIPPRKAFNDKPVLKVAIDKAIEKGLDPFELKDGQLSQKGIGGFTLCGFCNNNTGVWYAKAYISWVRQAFLLFERSGFKESTLYHPYHIFPLRIIKQIITMFFSVNSNEMRNHYTGLASFILNRENKYLDPGYKLYAYLNPSGGIRLCGNSVQGSIASSRIIVMSEIAFPPIGLVMTFDTQPPDNRLCDISYFSKYDYNSFTTIWLKLPVLPTHLLLPGDYRRKEEIMRDYLRNIALRN